MFKSKMYTDDLFGDWICKHAYVRDIFYKIRERNLKGVSWGEEGQPQQFLVRATFSSFSRPSHLVIFVLSISCVLKFPFLKDKIFFSTSLQLESAHKKSSWTTPARFNYFLLFIKSGPRTFSGVKELKINSFFRLLIELPNAFWV